MDESMPSNTELMAVQSTISFSNSIEINRIQRDQIITVNRLIQRPFLC